MRHFIRRALAVAALSVLPLSLGAQQTFTSFGAFLAAVGPIGIDSYDDIALGAFAGPLSRAAGPYAYGVAASAPPFDNLYGLANAANAADRWLSVEEASASITFSGFASTVFAIGGRFFATDLGGAVTGTAIRVQAVDVLGNFIDQTITPAAADAFFGVRFDNALASFTLTAVNDVFAGTAYFATANDLALGAQVVPEPATLWLLAAGAGALVLVARRRTPRV